MLQDRERRVVESIAQILIPPSAALPSTTDVDLSHQLIDRSLSVRPDLAGVFVDVLSRLVDDVDEDELDELCRRDPAGFSTVSLLLAASYFSSPAVDSALAYEPAPRAIRDDTDTYIELLTAVVERGFATRLPQL